MKNDAFEKGVKNIYCFVKNKEESRTHCHANKERK